MENKFFFTVVLNTDSTLYLKKISKKFKILNVPKMAKNGPKIPLHLLFIFLILKLSYLPVHSVVDYPEKTSKKFQYVEQAQNDQKCPQKPSTPSFERLKIA